MLGYLHSAVAKLGFANNRRSYTKLAWSAQSPNVFILDFEDHHRVTHTLHQT